MKGWEKHLLDQPIRHDFVHCRYQLMTSLWLGYYYSPRFTDEDTQAQRLPDLSKVTQLRKVRAIIQTHQHMSTSQNRDAMQCPGSEHSSRKRGRQGWSLELRMTWSGGLKTVVREVESETGMLRDPGRSFQEGAVYWPNGAERWGG